MWVARYWYPEDRSPYYWGPQKVLRGDKFTWHIEDIFETEKEAAQRILELYESELNVTKRKIDSMKARYGL